MGELFKNKVYVQLMGGLGNQMFEIAHGRAFSQRTGKQLMISRIPQGNRPPYWDTWFSLLNEYVVDNIETTDLICDIQKDPRFSHVPVETQALLSVYGSEKFFENVKDQVHQLFKLPNALQKDCYQQYKHLLTPTFIDDALVVHIRRTDFLMNPKTFGILTERYFISSLARARGDLGDRPIIVFSDDLAWCRERHWLRDAIFVDEPNDVRAMWLMSQFSNYIMSNSTFCWWAVYLGTQAKYVVAPDQWQGDQEPRMYEDLMPTHWIRHSVARNA